MAESKKIKQNWKRPKNFDTVFDLDFTVTAQILFNFLRSSFLNSSATQLQLQYKVFYIKYQDPLYLWRIKFVRKHNKI